MTDKKHLPMKRGDIWMANLGDRGEGCEQLGDRPVIIVSNDIGNHYSTIVTVASITSNIKRVYKTMPTHLHLPMNKVKCLHRDSICLMEQIHTVSKTRLRRMLGRVPDELLREMDLRLSISIGLD
jgi:mRNA interferase MazF